MRELSSISHRIHTGRRIMGGMGTAWKVLLGLVLVLPMTAYVVGSLVAAADVPVEHAPIIVEEQTHTPEPSQSPSDKPTQKPSDDKTRGHDQNDDHGGDDPQVITPSPDVFDDNGGDDNSGKGSGDDSGGDSSGKGSGDD
jgi:hypothetical protein